MVLLTAALLLGGCGDVNKGSAKGADFERALTARAGELVEDVTIGADNTLPWMGTFHASVTLRPTASDVDLDEVEGLISELLQGSSDTARVRANGVEICPEGTRRTQHLALRERLRLASTTLSGSLDCDTYSGQLSDVAVDTVSIQRAIAEDSAIAGLPVEGRIQVPRGRIDGLWVDLTPHLSRVLSTVPSADLNSFEIEGRALEIGVQPGLDVEKVRSAVASVAPDVALTITVGAPPEGATLGAEAAALRSDLLALEGVASVRFVSGSAVVVQVQRPQDVAATVPTAQALATSRGQFHLHVTTQSLDHPLWTVDSGADFELPVGATTQHLDDFSALVSDGGITAVGWREPADPGGRRMVTVTAPTGGDLRTVLPLVKRHVPTGADLSLHLGQEDYYLDAAPRLDRDDGELRELPATFVETWNAAP